VSSHRFVYALSLDGYPLADGADGIRNLSEDVSVAEASGIDVLTLGDPLAASLTEGVGLAAAETIAYLARKTSAIGLLSAASSHYSEPFHTAKAIATLDYISLGRAGVVIDVSQADVIDARFPDLPPLSLEERVVQAGEFVDVVRGLWDSWEDGSEIRELSTGRYVDSSKVHHINHSGEYFTVKGPLITPRPPQGQPIVAVRLDPAARATAEWSGLLRLAVSRADVVIVEATGDLSAFRAVVGELRDRAADLLFWARVSAADPAAALEQSAALQDVVDGVEFVLDGRSGRAALTELLRGVSDPWSGARSGGSAATLRGRLGLERPLSRFANARV
jgi:alkanesulfonate monooxygenase SsuD/methylene tetrahydromethanopterin reductase-like flavin-dependent oxidoreductase (luciferase family)